ncbi:MAG: hypothetical protein C0602_10060 [Denitrovibrio sp.]|nr:MAG: hypothetical protein C0602_10060 [Denitrovibrio sp.]
MGKTFDVADNLVKTARTLKYDDFDAKDKVIKYAGKLISEEFGPSSLYMQKLGLIVFSPKDGNVLGNMGADEEHIKRSVFNSGLERLISLLEDVRDSIGGETASGDRIVVVKAKDKISAARITSHIKAKGYETITIKDTDDWKEKLDKLLS